MEPGRPLTPSGAALLRVLQRGSVAAAPRLLGATLVSDVGGRVAVRVTEVEAYREDDPASHSARGRTPRTAVMFGPAGVLYVYFVYGMHWAANVSCGADGVGEAVLIRAGEVVEGVDLARTRRLSARRDADLARGPARLAAALGLDRAVLGVDLLDPASPVRLEPAPRRVVADVGPRVGVNHAADVPWRWWVPGDPTVSPFRAGTRRRNGPTAPPTDEAAGLQAARPKKRR
ncbi:DNA-3-methyladenine glycosylase [Jatrophihabitans sp. YIM 134969]